MKPASFEYYAPTHLEEATTLMAEHGYGAKLLAGGQSLIPVMNFRLTQPAVLVDLNHLSELKFLRRGDSGGLEIGAMVRHSRLESSQNVARYAPLLSQAVPHIAHPQIRSRGTLGGSLAHADPAAELPVVMVALEAKFLLAKRGGQRWVEAVLFYEGLFTTALEPDEILIEIALPTVEPGTGYSFLEIARRHGDFAQAGVAAVVSLDGDGNCRRARLVFLNLGDYPMVAQQAADLLLGQKPTPELVKAAAKMATENEIDPSTDIHGSAAYKRHLAQVLARQALEQAIGSAHSVKS